MYRIAILEKDRAYLDRFIDFLESHHSGSLEIHVVDAEEGEWEDVCLDSLEMEAVAYHALLLGDGVDTQDPIPAGVMIGYLTENDDEAQEGCISKYQSMEQIYRQMVRLCEAAGQDRDEDVEEREDEQDADGAGSSPAPMAAGLPERAKDRFRPHDVPEDGETYRVWHIEKGQIDRLAIRMLTGNMIKGLPQISYQDGELRLKITGLMPLDQYVRENDSPDGKQQLFKLFCGMCQTALGLDEFMLTADGLVLDPAEIFVDAKRSTAVLSYIPVKGVAATGIRQFLQELSELCAMLIQAIDSPGSVQEPDDRHAAPKETGKPRENAADMIRNREEMPYLIRKKGNEKIWIDRNVFRLGKDASCVDYQIADNPTISRGHADIVRKQDGFYLIDKGSLNHTFVNGRMLKAGECRKLENGCLLQLADEVFKFIERPRKQIVQ